MGEQMILFIENVATNINTHSSNIRHSSRLVDNKDNRRKRAETDKSSQVKRKDNEFVKWPRWHKKEEIANDR